VIRSLLNSLLYFPSRVIPDTPAAAGLAFDELTVATDDGERLHGWWVGARTPAAGHILLCHGNAGNIADRIIHARLLSAAGFDLLLFDYRGYGRSTGKPSEEGTYRDARAMRSALMRQPGVDGSRVFYVGESLGGAVALALALESPPRGLILQSTFTGVREMAREHYPFIPRAVVPDAYPSLRQIRGLRAPLLVLHGAKDDIVPVSHGQALFDAAPGPKGIHLFPGLGHNDLVSLAGADYAEVIASWAKELSGLP
jgi:fermentation-respiration switch protein FrsA (DUF1100 family)